MTKNQNYALERHWVQLKELGYIGATMAQINALERRIHKAAEQYANGEITTNMYEKLEKQFTEKATQLFDGTLPDGFFINSDPRGYALKIDPNKRNDCPITRKDWGGYMILAPEF